MAQASQNVAGSAEAFSDDQSVDSDREQFRLATMAGHGSRDDGEFDHKDISDFDETVSLENLSMVEDEEEHRRVWREYFDPVTQQSFYLDTLTQRTQWELPDDADRIIQSVDLNSEQCNSNNHVPLRRGSSCRRLRKRDSSNARSNSESNVLLSSTTSHGMVRALIPCTGQRLMLVHPKTIGRQYLTLKNLVGQEKRFIEHLENLTNVYVRPLQVLARQNSKEADILKLPAVAVLLSNVSQVLAVSRGLVADLEALLW
jgi:hypothetical protein